MDNLLSWLQDVRSVATGEKSPTVNFSLDKSTVVNLALGFFAAVTLSLIIKESVGFFFRSLEK